MNKNIGLFKIIKKTKETPNSYSFTFCIPDEQKSQFQFIPGQYITISLVDKNGIQHNRHYSITCPNNAQHISFCVKRVPNGIVSNLLCDEYPVGSTLQVNPPTGNFFLDDLILADYKTLVFITAGSGITPIKSMIDQALANNFNGNIFLIYANSTVDNIIFHEHLMNIQQDENEFIFILDEPSEGWLGEIGKLTSSKIKELFLKYKIPYKNTYFFTSGPLGVIDNVVNHLKVNKVAETAVKFEKFFVAASTENLSTETHPIKIRHKGKDLTISIPPNQTILDASLSAGLNIEHLCKTGNCLTCVAVLKSGKVYSTIEREGNSNEILTCQSYPLNDNVVLDFDKAIVQSIFANRNMLLACSFLLSFFLLLFFTAPANELYLAKGTFNTGHDSLNCVDCHKPAPGTMRQQLQSNAKSFLFHNDDEYVQFGNLKVGNKECLSCHNRPNDIHPTHRFMEPRFASARKEIHPENCTSCHKEHTGERVTIGQMDFCQHCHQDIKINNDPLSISHEHLISTNQWNTCLQCHDFHGSHIFKPPTNIRDTIALEMVENYFEGGEDPYGEIQKYVTDSIFNNKYSLQ